MKQNIGVALVFIGIYLMWGAAGTYELQTIVKTTPTPMWVLAITILIGIVIAAVGVNIANLPNKED